MSLVKKILKEGIVIVTALAAFSGCGGSGGGGSYNNGLQPDYQAKIIGDIYNTGPVLSRLKKHIEKIVLPNQVIAQEAREESLPDVVLNDFIEVSSSVKNLSTTSTLKDVIVEIKIEDPIFLTPESWRCMKEFKRRDGYGGIGTLVWEEYGGIKGKEQAPPVRECSGSPFDPLFVCDNTIFDCSKEEYNIRYDPPGEGFWSSISNVGNIEPGQEIFMATGYRHGQMTTGSRLGIWKAKIKNETINGIEEQLLDEKRYRFNIIPEIK